MPDINEPTDAEIEEVARAIAGADQEDYMEDHALYDRQAKAALLAARRVTSVPSLADGIEAAAKVADDAQKKWASGSRSLDATPEMVGGASLAAAALGASDIAKAIRALAHNPQASSGGATHRHKKRGTEYALIGYGRMQAENWEEQRATGFSDENAFVGMSVDMREVAIYRSATDPTEIWARPREEFEDGRFEVITESATPEGNEAEAPAPAPIQTMSVDEFEAWLKAAHRDVGITPKLQKAWDAYKAARANMQTVADAFAAAPAPIQGDVTEAHSDDLAVDWFSALTASNDRVAELERDAALELIYRARAIHPNGVVDAAIASTTLPAGFERDQWDSLLRARLRAMFEEIALKAVAAEAEVSRLKAGTVTDAMVQKFHDAARRWWSAQPDGTEVTDDRTLQAVRAGLEAVAIPEHPAWIADLLNRRWEVEHVLRAPTNIAKRNASRKDGKPEPLPDPLTPEQMWELANKLSVPSEFGAKTEASK